MKLESQATKKLGVSLVIQKLTVPQAENEVLIPNASIKLEPLKYIKINHNESVY